MLLLLLGLLGLAGDVETSRIRAHLASVEVELRSTTNGSLSPEVARRRAAVIDELARYRKRAVFPHNASLAYRAPFFVDDRGVRCAMAHLIEVFDGGVLVSRVERDANNAYIAELAEDPQLRAWLRDHGLTLAEAARIQPTYDHRSAVGFRCTTDADCMTNLCIAALDGSQEHYCSTPCEVAAPECPAGSLETAMDCRLVEDRALCVYDGGIPGAFGWACDPASQLRQCEVICLESEGLCTTACSDSSGCPDGFFCGYASQAPDAMLCQPGRAEGCTAHGHAPGSLVTAFTLMLLLLGRRRGSTPAA